MAELTDRTLRENVIIRLRYLKQVSESGRNDAVLQQRIAEVLRRKAFGGPFCIYPTKNAQEIHFSMLVSQGETNAVTHGILELRLPDYGLGRLDIEDEWIGAIHLPPEFRELWTLHAGIQILMDQLFESLPIAVRKGALSKAVAEETRHRTYSCCGADAGQEFAYMLTVVEAYTAALTKQLNYV